MKSVVLLALVCALAIGCDRDERRRSPTANDEVPTPVERPDATAGEDWCKEHGVPESRCAPCLARRGSGWSLGAGTCGVVTTTCEDPALGPGIVAPELTTAKQSEDRGSPTRRRSRTRAGGHP